MSEQSRNEDLLLLRRFEPAARYTRGEQFFPMDVGRYVEQCSLWLERPNQPAELLVPQGEMTLEKLSQPRQDGFGALCFLKFIEPPDIIELARDSLNEAVRSLTDRLAAGGQEAHDVFHAGIGRLARVGYASRLVDALFSLTLVLRGRVPGDTAVAAARAYRRLQNAHEAYTYYGRVVRENGWVILQYWYFYPFNNWRSGFFGVNDHEADWEMVCVYCWQDDSLPGGVAPQWAAFASHDFSGDDLRRRWDDPELEKITDAEGDEHPVIYAGAGSHASYFSRGEYLTELEIPLLAPLERFSNWAQLQLANTMRRLFGGGALPHVNIFRIPFVDYARGDGLTIGPAGEKAWQPQLLDDSTPWAADYRGLWGLHARDPISGENAPAGPVYNRDGLTRRSWYDPLGWAGLDKLPPPDEMQAVLQTQLDGIAAENDALEALIEAKSRELTRLGVEAEALRGHNHLWEAHEQLDARIGALSAEARSLRQQRALGAARREALEMHTRRLEQGDPGDARAHIHRSHRPSPPAARPMARLAEVVAAISIGLLMVGIVLMIVFARQYLLVGLAALIGMLIFVEAGFRGQLPRLVTSLTVGFAIVAALVLLFEFFWQAVFLGVLVAGIFIIWENLREILGH